MPNYAGLDRFSCVGLNNNNCGIIYIRINRSILPTKMCYTRSGCSSATCAVSLLERKVSTAFGKCSPEAERRVSQRPWVSDIDLRCRTCLFAQRCSRKGV